MHRRLIPVLLTVACGFLATGCVERTLTIRTEPAGAMVTLNDEQVGLSPVTVPFEWYGDYGVRITKAGYETLDTHRKLKAPWYDYPPFDFLIQIADPTRVVDAYEWTFELAPKEYPTREELIEKADALRSQVKQ